MAAGALRADVVVIGGGLAGIAAALDLLDGGRSVLILERAGRPRLGGLARWSFGGVFFVGSPEQRFTGIRDSVDLALADWMAYGEIAADDRWPRRWAEAYVSRCLPDVRGWTRRHGVRYFPAVNWTERGYFVPGNSVPRFHMVWGTGQGLVDTLVARLEGHAQRARLDMRFGHRVEELSTEGGRFVGCRGSGPDGTSFEARGDAVVIAAGGIAGDLAKVRQHWPKAWGEPPETLLNGSFPEADGAIMEDAQRQGASVSDLSRMWNYAAGVRHWKPLHDLHGLSLVPGKSALWVDAHGRRFVDPPLVGSFDTLHLVERVCKEPLKYSWQVLNWRIARKELAVSGAEFNRDIRDRKLLPFLGRLLLGADDLVKEFVEGCPDFVTADSVEELAARMNQLTGTGAVDPGVLAAEVARYDANVGRPAKLQNDDQLRRIAHVRRYAGDRLRTCKDARIDDPDSRPLIAIRLSIVTRKSLGGLVVDLQGRVLDRRGEPLPGLYAAGEACGFGGGGIHGKRALEGTFLGGCIFTGRAVALSLVSGRACDAR